MIECEPAVCAEASRTALEFIGYAIPLTVYLAIGVYTAGQTDSAVNDAVAEAGHNPAWWGLYVSAAIALLWPVFALITVFTTAHATLSEVEE